jgi:LysM repeat protein
MARILKKSTVEDMKRKLIILLFLTASFLLVDAFNSAARAYAGKTPEAGQEYVLRKGDTLWRIAEQAYGSGIEVRRIKEANPWIEDKQMIPGTVIRIPAMPAPTGPVPPASLEAELAEAGALEPAEVEDPLAKVLAESEPVEPAEEVASTEEDTPPEPVAEPAPVEAAPVEPEPVEPAVAEPAEEPRVAQATPSTVHADPGAIRPVSGSVWNTLQNRIESKTLFGASLEMFGCYVLLFCLIHAIMQGLIVWITSHITFVREASIRKSFKASFLTEMLTLCTLVVISIVAIMMLYVGTENVTEGASTQLFPLVEEYLSTPVGLLAVGCCLLALHVLLSLRFIPQIFEIRRAQAFLVVVLGVLAPHLAGFYVVGKKMGFIQV